MEAANEPRPGQVYQNGGLPIDLGNDGPTPNAASLGDYAGYPVLARPGRLDIVGERLPRPVRSSCSGAGRPGRAGRRRDTAGLHGC